MKSWATKLSLVGGCALLLGLFTSQKNNQVLKVEKLIVGGDGKASIEMFLSGNTPILSFKDEKGKTTLQLMGGPIPSIHLFDSENAGVEPSIVVGVIQQVPHLFISGKQNNDGVLMHGGSPTSLLFLDQKGDVQVAVSRMGFYAKPAKGAEESEEKPPFFSLEDFKEKMKKINGNIIR